ncbi:hypothetical protein Nepgr_018764 [Nepenthes gracilis]|uniref:Uncharacterized protein n=1 Tax=Nepenthes gracilis TaxID=150966 RepID=A0AAD3SRY6_NEPGR|nr:hypothetical protein Nepgr_018764 [Nepenthes gracilis]
MARVPLKTLAKPSNGNPSKQTSSEPRGHQTACFTANISNSINMGAYPPTSRSITTHHTKRPKPLGPQANNTPFSFLTERKQGFHSIPLGICSAIQS